ncbi:unnamed protein product [Rotaria magnacalcarata]|nr:unnamed protein product [Rotaria magnacalcarata]CAF2092375.1 unnamed protein product [Rotaria magnacalcarata]
MNQSDIHLLDLPNEILLTILKKLDNIDILYSLCGINNERLDILIQNIVSNNILDFVITSPMTDVKLDRFCSYILPRSHHYIKKLILDTTSMERILLAGDYPNLTSLELFNFEQKIGFHYFIDDTPFRHIFKHQITDLILHNNDEYDNAILSNIYTKDVYAYIMVFFQSLKILKIIASSEYDYPPLVIWNHQSTTWFSSTLTVLCITVFGFDHCLFLLDGRLKQLTTFKVQVHAISRSMLIDCNKEDLINLKCFSLTNYNYTYEYEYDDLVVPLLRRMTYLEKLTLYLRIKKVGRFVSGASLSIDGAHLHNEILVHMPQLHTFKFYISTETNAIYSNLRFSNDDIQQTFINMKYGQTACIMDYYGACGTICHVYSLPFTFTQNYDSLSIYCI